MDAFERMLLSHASRYNKMLPVDAVKLCYQNAFGVGHLLSDPDAHLARLLSECAATAPDALSPLSEDIGNGLCRVNLSALPFAPFSAHALHAACVFTARTFHGDRDAFFFHLDQIYSLAQRELLPFSSGDAAAFLSEYRSLGCPAVSHSDAYRAAYMPAYRVVCASLLPR